jgi:hypothetical protein
VLVIVSVDCVGTDASRWDDVGGRLYRRLPIVSPLSISFPLNRTRHGYGKLRDAMIHDVLV